MAKKYKGLAAVCAVLAAVILIGFGIYNNIKDKAVNSTSFVMDTVVTQTVWGPAAKKAAAQAEELLQTLEAELSLYSESSEIAAVNAAAGQSAVAVSGRTFALLDTALTLGAQSDGFFQVTVAPLSRLWNVMDAEPVVPAQSEIDAALALVDDTAVMLDTQAQTVQLIGPGQALDLGGIAKGYACDLLREAYLKSGVKHALTSIGGNICAVGGNTDGTPYRIGFRDPKGGVGSYMASFLISDGVVAVSGAYERFFEQDGVIYHHIIDPHTGYPAVSDIVSVGVVWPADAEQAQTLYPGASADHWSTTLFCWGREKTLEWMKTSPAGVLLLDDTGTLYVSESLKDGFKTYDETQEVVFVENLAQKNK